MSSSCAKRSLSCTFALRFSHPGDPDFPSGECKESKGSKESKETKESIHSAAASSSSSKPIEDTDMPSASAASTGSAASAAASVALAAKPEEDSMHAKPAKLESGDSVDPDAAGSKEAALAKPVAPDPAPSEGKDVDMKECGPLRLKHHPVVMMHAWCCPKFCETDPFAPYAPVKVEIVIAALTVFHRTMVLAAQGKSTFFARGVWPTF